MKPKLYIFLFLLPALVACSIQHKKLNQARSEQILTLSACQNLKEVLSAQNKSICVATEAPGIMPHETSFGPSKNANTAVKHQRTHTRNSFESLITAAAEKRATYLPASQPVATVYGDNMHTIFGCVLSLLGFVLYLTISPILLLIGTITLLFGLGFCIYGLVKHELKGLAIAGIVFSGLALLSIIFVFWFLLVAF